MLYMYLIMYFHVFSLDVIITACDVIISEFHKEQPELENIPD